MPWVWRKHLVGGAYTVLFEILQNSAELIIIICKNFTSNSFNFPSDNNTKSVYLRKEKKTTITQTKNSALKFCSNCLSFQVVKSYRI